MKNYNLFLDDVRIPSDAFNYTKDSGYLKKDWATVRNFEDFCNYIEVEFKEGKFPGLISFDHDLMDIHYETGDRGDVKGHENLEKTGYHCAKWLCEFCIDNKMKLPSVLVHSMNPIGADRIKSIIKDYKREFEL